MWVILLKYIYNIFSPVASVSQSEISIRPTDTTKFIMSKQKINKTI